MKKMKKQTVLPVGHQVEARSTIQIRDRTRRLIATIPAGTKGRIRAKKGLCFTIDWEGIGVQVFDYDPDSHALGEDFSDELIKGLAAQSGL